MNFAFTPEHRELRDSLRRFFASKSPMAEVRRLADSPDGYDPLVWKQMAQQLGLQGLAIPEEYGGSGFTAVEFGIVFEEMGRALHGGPFFATVGLAAQVLLALDDDDAKARWLPSIADGSLIATLAVTEAGGEWGVQHVRASATPAGQGWLVDGTKMFVPDGRIADLLLVAARVGDELGVFAVDPAQPGVVRTALSGLDLTRRLARVEFAGATARRIGPDSGGDAAPALSRALDMASVALASEQAGAAERCLEMAVEYAKTRVQFGRPIGSFQAIKHKCADMLVEVESAKSAAYYAARSAADSAGELPVAAALANAYCSDAFFRIAAESIQVHGGVGYTWEHDAHLYLRRAKSSQLLFGDPAHHRARLADLVGI
ncbi:MAG TPA: acyl-CoA dehydrogenase family protein [Trebonia sp.]|nr:acyl-CoA dehydrogenase family protein [Trebonia sp.]